MFADGDVSAKLVGYGGLWLVTLAPLIVAYATGTNVLQSAYQRGDAPTAGGYWILKSDGGVDNFNAPWYGSMRGQVPAGQKVTGIVAE